MLGFFVFLILLMMPPDVQGKVAEVIWYNGTILTMNDRQPSAGGLGRLASGICSGAGASGKHIAHRVGP